MEQRNAATEKVGYDIIGDIHGHSEVLKALLEHLGYEVCRNGRTTYRHPDGRIAVFLGDYINKGPDSPGVVEIVQNMVKNAGAIALMGNHELKEILKHYKEDRESALFKQIGDIETYEKCIDFLKKLHPFYQIGSALFVHACWPPGDIEIIRDFCDDDLRLTEDAFEEWLINEKEPFYSALSLTLNGMYHRLPPGLSFPTVAGNRSEKASIRWWQRPDQPTSEKLVLHGYQFTDRQREAIDDQTLPAAIRKIFAQNTGKIIFCGHYSDNPRQPPQLSSDRVVSLDTGGSYGDGTIVAYRYDDRYGGSGTLEADNLVWLSKSGTVNKEYPRDELIL